MDEQYYYSALTGGFYRECDRDIYETSANGWPTDAVMVSVDDYKTLLDGQANGRIIVANDSGSPVLIDPAIDWQAKGEQQRQSLLTTASEVIADWRTELQLGMISDVDKASLVEWMTYIKALKSLDLNNISDEKSLGLITWPSKPKS